MYRDLYDEKHRLHQASFAENKVQSKLKQTGAYEKHILCSDCDNGIIGKLERYASLVLFGGVDLGCKMEKNEAGIHFSHFFDIDYPQFKLFLLSVLWRVGISSLPIFRLIDLKHHGDILRQMILKNDPGKCEEYPCVIFTYLNNQKIPHQLIGEPGFIFNDREHICFLLIGGNLFLYFLADKAVPEWVLGNAINERNELRLIHMTERMASTTVNKFIGIELF